MTVARPVSIPSPEEGSRRSPGRVNPNGHWAVLDESKKVSEGYVHSCGQDIEAVTLYLTVRDGYFNLSGSGETVPETVPYCPKCEDEPKSGYATSDGKVHIN